MSRTSLISSRRIRALRERPATDTRLLPLPFPTRRWKVHRPLPARPPTGGLSQPMLRPASGAPRHPRGPLCPRPRRKTCGKPMAPRTNSPVAPLGTPLSHSDGKEDTPDPLRRVESVWGSYPFPDSPVFPLGDSCSLRDGRESALPSLRMAERFPHTDRLELPPSPADLRAWRRLAPQPLRPGHGPSIAYTSLLTPSPSVIPSHPSVIPDPDRESIPGVGPLMLSVVEVWAGGWPTPCHPISRHAKSPEIPIGVVQSKQLRVQSKFNQCLINVQSIAHPHV